MDVAKKKWNPIYSNYRRLAREYTVNTYIGKKTSIYIYINESAIQCNLERCNLTRAEIIRKGLTKTLAL